jgi:hypothetical protein
MNHFDELKSAHQYFKNAAVTSPANASLFRSGLEVSVVDGVAQGSGHIASK